MIPARDTKSRWVVSLKDDALSDFENGKIREYAESRDISVLGIDTKTGIVSSNGKPATLFLVEPLKQVFANLADPEVRNRNALISVFATHVKDARNAPCEMSRDGDVLKQSVLEQIPIDMMAEIATVVIELATGGGRGVTIPFSLPDGFWAERRDMKAMLAKAAERKIATPESGTPKTEMEKEGMG